MMTSTSPLIVDFDSPAFALAGAYPTTRTTTSSSTTSLAATLTPGTPVAVDYPSDGIKSLSSLNLDSLRASTATSTSSSSTAPAASSSSASIIPPGPPSTSSESSESSSLSLSSIGSDGDDYEYEAALQDDDACANDDLAPAMDEEWDGGYGSAIRHQRAKEAARILLSQCLLDDNPRYYSDDLALSSNSRTSRLGLAPVTLLLNPETPCPTKIIPLPISSTSTTSSIMNTNMNVSYASSDVSESSEGEQEAMEVQEAQEASLFIRLL